MIPKSPPPTIADPDSVSKEYNELIFIMLVKDRDRRPDTGRRSMK
jgi:hypothetical protein